MRSIGGGFIATAAMTHTSAGDDLARWLADEAAIRDRQRLAAGLARRRAPVGERPDLVFAADGECAFQGRPQFKHYKPLGSVHGGWFATLLDPAPGCKFHAHASTTCLPLDLPQG